MKRYDKYKDSGVAWLGQVPSHWEVTKIGKHYKIVLGKMLSPQPSSEADTYEKYFCAKDVHFEGVNKNDLKEMWFSPSEKSKYIVQNEDLLIVEGGSAGECAIIQINNDEQIYIQNSLLIARSGDNSTIFLKYFLENLVRAGYITITCNAATFVHYTKEKVCSTPLSLPPLAEQEAIAAYLDEKCEAIDGMVEKIEEKIALFQRLRRAIITRAVTRGLNLDAPLRPSGIDWIGEIPEHWEVCAIKQMAKLYGRIGFRGYTSADLVDEGQGAITLSPSNIVDGKMDYSKCSFLSWDKYYESPEIMIENGDVLFVKTASVGKTAFVENLPLAATLNPQIAVFKNIKGSKKFLSYLLRSSYITALTTVNVGGSTVPTISQQTIGNYIIPLPPLAEQQAIADYLDRKCGKIDELVAKYEQQKELLARYKKALIAQVVTGQRRVCKPVFNYQTEELDNSSISMAAENNI